MSLIFIKKFFSKKIFLSISSIIIFSFVFILILIAQVNYDDESWVYKEKGDKFFAYKDYAKAIEYYEKALQLNPKYAEVYYMLGNIYKIKKLFDIALTYYKYAEQYKKYFKIKEMYFYLLYDISEIFFYIKNYSNFLEYNYKIIQNDNYYKYFNKEVFSIINVVPEGENLYSKSYFRVGYFYFFSQNFENSLKYFIYSKLYKYRLDITHWILSKLMFIQSGTIQYKEYEKIAYNLNPNIEKFDSKFKWKKIPFDYDYLLQMEIFINEFSGYYYLIPKSEINKKYNK